MSAIKHLLTVDNFDKKILDIFKGVVGVNNHYIIEDFTDFYKLRYSYLKVAKISRYISKAKNNSQSIS